MLEPLKRAAEQEKTGGARVGAVLNSAFCLWFLSSVVVTFGTFVYTLYQQRRDKYEANEAQAKRLNTELRVRMHDFWQTVTQVEANLTACEKEHSSPKGQGFHGVSKWLPQE